MKDHNLYTIIPYKDKLIKCFNPNFAYAYFLNKRINLITGEMEIFSISNWIEDYKKIKLFSIEKSPKVIHLFYEFGFITEKLSDLISEEQLLVVDIDYQECEDFKIKTPLSIDLEQIGKPDFLKYKKEFEEGYQELLKGNCYQFNLTQSYLYSFDSRLVPLDFIMALWKNENSRGAFGSATYIPILEKLFLSNSPECLFQIKGNELSTMPIKGTVKYKKGDNLKVLWKNLISDKKNQAELYMITDLLRNDLSRIELPKAYVSHKKILKRVPGLLHQCSKINVELGSDVTLWRVIEKIFPGGSITGAPKTRAIKLIHHLEKRERNFYCGSTLILFGSMKSASINIRSGVFDFKKHSLLYQAGGGITLESDVHGEFEEMTYKCESFIGTLTL